VSAQGLENHVRGLVSVDERMLTILDFDRMLTAEAMAVTEGAAS
jgi:chemotaxis signal transduction protein